MNKHMIFGLAALAALQAAAVPSARAIDDPISPTELLRYWAGVGREQAEIVPPAAAAPALKSQDDAGFAEIDALYLHRNEPGKLQQSIDKLKERIDNSSYDAAAQWRLGRSLIALGDSKENEKEKLAAYAQAAQRLNVAVSWAPKDFNAHYWLAREMGQENDIRRTIRLAKSMKVELEKAIELNGSNASAHQIYGELLRQLPSTWPFNLGGDNEKAVVELEKAMSLDPNSVACYPALAHAYIDRNADGDKAKAIAVLEKAFSVATPSDPDSYQQDLKETQELLKTLKK